MFSVAEHVLREACIETKRMSAHTRLAFFAILFMFNLSLRLLNTTKCRTTLRLPPSAVVLNWYVTATLGSFKM
jgi:hypothetical protein